MKRRNNGDGSASGGEDRWATGWAEAWGESEQERVARWLTAKGRVAVDTRGAPVSRRPVRPVDPWEAADLLDLREITAEPPAAAPVAPHPAPAGPGPVTAEELHARSALEAEIAYLEDERRRLTARLEDERAEAERVLGDLSTTAAELHEHVAHLEDERRNVTARLEDERAEAERVRRDLATAAAMLHEHVAGLEQERCRVLEDVEASVAAAEQARADEQAARAALESARAEARVVEAEHFEVWIALEEEVSALAARRRRLRGLRRRHVVGRAAPAS